MSSKRCVADDGYWKRKVCNKECEYADTCIYRKDKKKAEDKLLALKVQEKELKETNKHDIGELQIYQNYSLDRKIQLTCERIKAWYEWWDGKVYISFSGGKDSTVLLDLVRNECGLDDVPAVFCDTGLEYPEIREFVKTYDNVIWLKPKKNFKQVIKEYGYPFISKEVSECVAGAKQYLTSLLNEATLDKQASKQASKQATSTITTSCLDLESIASKMEERRASKQGGKNLRLARLMGLLTTDNQIKANIPSKDYSRYNQTKYKFFLDAPFNISNKCCNVMKKAPAHEFERKSGLKPYIGTTCAESMLRTQKWLQEGCNAFYSTNPHSKPLSFWTEQDILLYIKTKGLKICSVYGDIVEDTVDGQVEGQMTFSDLDNPMGMELFDADRPPLKTTGCSRTGCVMCLFGVHLEKSPNRLEQLKVTHPKLYDYMMRPESEGGLGYKEKIDWVNEHSEGKIHINY